MEKAKAALEAQLAAANISDEGWFGYIFSKNTSNEMKYEDFPYSKSKKFLWKKISQKKFLDCTYWFLCFLEILYGPGPLF